MNHDAIMQQFDMYAKQYDAGRRCFIPCFDDYYVRSVSLLKNIKNDIHNVADLGAGTGLLSAQMFKLYPTASFTLIDLSPNMLDIAKKRFYGLSNFYYKVDDYAKGLSKNYDCICSALSIHHLENNEKQQLYNETYKSLSDGGCFLTLDQFCADCPIINKAYDEWWLNYIDNNVTTEEKSKWLERRKLDKEISVSTTISMLKSAGFNHVECVYEFMKFATIIAIK